MQRKWEAGVEGWQWGWSPLPVSRDSGIGTGSAESRGGCGAYSSILSTTGRDEGGTAVLFTTVCPGVWETAAQNEIPEAQDRDKEKLFFLPTRTVWWAPGPEEVGWSPSLGILEFSWMKSWAALSDLTDEPLCGRGPEAPGLPVWLRLWWYTVYRETHFTADLLLQLCL